MTPNENPLPGGQRASASIVLDAQKPTPFRQKLQANPAHRARLAWLMWSQPTELRNV